MTTHLGWPEILLRLALTVVAGGIIGLNRGEHGHPAGLRTTLLVCLAASISMIQVILLLDLRGKAWDSFIVMDLMRLPLGILSGMGFIGAGAILRQGDRVLGITTAATLWFATVMGLCFGGGQIILGLAALALVVIVLSLMKGIETRVHQDRRGSMTVKLLSDDPSDEEVSRKLKANGYRIASWGVVYSSEPKSRELRFALHWRKPASDLQPPALVAELAETAGVLEIEWRG